MPTWLKCNSCGEKFYTAKSYHFIDDQVCEECGSKLKSTLNFYKQKRKYPRIKVNKKIEYKLKKSYKRNFKKAKIIDISLNGILITSRKISVNQVEKNKKIFLKIKTEHNKIELKGRIARITEIKKTNKVKIGLGIEFINVDEEKKKILNKLQYKKISAS